MKIAAARAVPVKLRFARPVQTARGSCAGRTSIILELRDADGRRGYGEAAPWPGFATESMARAGEALADFARRVVGEGADAGAWLDLTRVGMPDAPAARAAVQGALLDLEARELGLPIAEHLAARADVAPRPALRGVPCSALLLEGEPDALRLEAARARAAGFRAAKIKLGGGTLEQDVARARAAREGLGADVQLRGDANGAWDERTTIVALERLAQFDFAYVEQPVAPDDLEGLVRLRGRTPVAIAADESVAGEEGAARLIAAGAVDVVVLKPAMLGGPMRALELATRAKQAGILTVFTHAFESAVGARHVLGCAAAWGDAGTAHGLDTGGLFERDVAEPVRSHGGVAQPSDAPGLGIEL